MNDLVRVETDGQILTAVIIEPRLLDAAAIQQLEKHLMDALGKSNEQRLIVDFRPVNFMSSSALGTLVRFRSKCQEYKVELKLTGINTNIREVFQITRLDKIFEIHNTPEDAREAWKKSGGWFRK
jgi:anti-anti-sigma factor